MLLLAIKYKAEAAEARKEFNFLCGTFLRRFVFDTLS